MKIRVTYAGADDIEDVLVYIVFDGDEPLFASLNKAACETYISYCHECGYDYTDQQEGCDTCAPLKVQP